MRKILFRGKRVDNGEWVYGYLIEKDVIVGEIIDFDNEYFTTEFWYKVIPETVGQFTGIHDKNGVEIYEGDIFKNSDGFIGVIEFDTYFQKTRICEYKNGCSTDEESEFNFVVAQYGEVIGNIHDEDMKKYDDTIASENK